MKTHFSVANRGPDGLRLKGTVRPALAVLIKSFVYAALSDEANNRRAKSKYCIANFEGLT